MAFQLSQSSQPVRLCMPLTKFSYANVHAGSIGPIPWTHLSSQGDLFVILDPVELAKTSGVIERKYNFKVLQDPNIKEEIDLSLLASAAQQAICEVQRSGVSGQQPSVTVIVKIPCVAMRYPLHDGQVRRFQVRFTNHEDFYETLKVFTRTKLPFVDAGTVSHLPQPTVVNNQPVVSSIAPHSFAPSQNGVADRLSRPHLDPPNRTPDDSNSTTTTSKQPTFSTLAAPQQKVSGTGSTSNCQPPKPAVSLLNNHVGERPVVFDGHNNPTLQPWPASSISTYVPRPSTAPIATIQQPSSDLPPKRDLPFERKTRQSVSSAPQIHQDLPSTVQAISTSAVETENTRITELTNLEQGSGPKTKKRAPARPKRAAATKKSKTAPRGKDLVETSQHSIEFNVVGEATQVNNQSQSSHATQSRLDTQVLLDKAESIQESRKAECKSARDTATIFVEGIGAQGESVTSAVISQPNVRNKMPNYRPTSHSVAQLAFDPESSTSVTTNNVPFLEQAGRVNGEQQASNLNQTKISTNVDTTPSSVPPVHPQLQPQWPPNLATLLSNPDFAQPAIETPPSSSSSFDDLSPADRHTLLESWMVQNFDNANFLNLCKTLEGVWQRVFVKP